MLSAVEVVSSACQGSFDKLRGPRNVPVLAGTTG